MAAYVSLERAKKHLNLTVSDFDDTVNDKVELASAIIGDYLQDGAEYDATWDESTTPMVVQAATLLLVTHLFEHRGEDMATDEQMWQAISRLLMRYRDPALA